MRRWLCPAPESSIASSHALWKETSRDNTHTHSSVRGRVRSPIYQAAAVSQSVKAVVE